MDLISPRVSVGSTGSPSRASLGSPSVPWHSGGAPNLGGSFVALVARSPSRSFHSIGSSGSGQATPRRTQITAKGLPTTYAAPPYVYKAPPLARQDHGDIVKLFRSQLEDERFERSAALEVFRRDIRQMQADFTRIIQQMHRQQEQQELVLQASAQGSAGQQDLQRQATAAQTEAREPRQSGISLQEQMDMHQQTQSQPASSAPLDQLAQRICEEREERCVCVAQLHAKIGQEIVAALCRSEHCRSEQLVEVERRYRGLSLTEVRTSSECLEFFDALARASTASLSRQDTMSQEIAAEREARSCHVEELHASLKSHAGLLDLRTEAMRQDLGLELGAELAAERATHHAIQEGSHRAHEAQAEELTSEREAREALAALHSRNMSDCRVKLEELWEHVILPSNPESPQRKRSMVICAEGDDGDDSASLVGVDVLVLARRVAVLEARQNAAELRTDLRLSGMEVHEDYGSRTGLRGH